MKYEIFISKKPQDGRKLGKIKGMPVITPIQTHGNHAVFVSRSTEKKPKADALITKSKNFWIGVLTADCLPLFLIGEGIVGVVHAGWRGTLKGITFNVAKRIKKFSPVKKAVLGVSICGKCYEVGEDVFSLFPEDYLKCFRKIEGEKYLFDLKEANRIQLNAAGVREIEYMNRCTVCNNDLFYSYRKEKTKKRILSAVRIV